MTVAGNDEFTREISSVYDDQNYFCEYMGGYDRIGSGRLGPRYAMAVHLAQSNSAKIQRVLDIGCGRGELVNYFCSKGIEAVGIDYSRAACEIASGLLAKNPKRELGTILNVRDNNLDLPDSHFDAAFMLDVVEHLYPHQLDRYYAQLRKLLRPGGILIIHTYPNRLQKETMPEWYEVSIRKILALPARILLDRAIKTSLRDDCEKLIHVNEHTPKQLESHLSSHGFRARVFTSYYVGRTPNSLSDLFAEFLLNMGPLGFLPHLNRYLNRYLWAIAKNPVRKNAENV